MCQTREDFFSCYITSKQNDNYVSYMVFPVVGQDYKICNTGGKSQVTGVLQVCGNYGGMLCYTTALTKNMVNHPWANNTGAEHYNKLPLQNNCLVSVAPTLRKHTLDQ